MPSGFKIYIFPSCIYRIPTQCHLWVAMKHTIKQKKNMTGEKETSINGTSMITVTGDYCAFIRSNCPPSASDQSSADGKKFPLSRYCFLCPREQESINQRGENKPHTLQMISQSGLNCTTKKKKYI